MCVPINYTFFAWGKNLCFGSHLLYGKFYVTKRSVTFSFVFHFRLMWPREGRVLFSLIGEDFFQMGRNCLKSFFFIENTLVFIFFQSISDWFLNNLFCCILYFFSSSKWRVFLILRFTFFHSYGDITVFWIGDFLLYPSRMF